MQYFLLSTDLFFGSQISATATAAGSHVAEFGDTATLVNSVKTATPDSCVLLDLTCPPVKANIAGLVKALRDANGDVRIVAYGPHVQSGLLAQAQEAGCDDVMTRGQFHAQLDHLFRGVDR